MSKNKLLNNFKDKKNLKNETVNTITCSLDKLLNKNCYISKPIKISEIKRTDILENYGIDQSFYTEYKTSNDIISFKKGINNITEWVSDLKMMSSTFNNFLVVRLVEDNIEIPELNDCFFTQSFSAISGKKSNYSKYFDEFSNKFLIPYYFPWMSNTSQIICDVKNEMSVVTKNNIIINFEKRMKSTIRWRILDFLALSKGFCNLEKNLEYLQEITELIFKKISGNRCIYELFEELNKKYKIVCDIQAIINIFQDDIEIFNKALKNNLNSRKQLLLKKKEKIETNDKQLEYQEALEKNPQNFISYMVFIQKKISNTTLYKTYNSCIREFNKKFPKKPENISEKKERQKYWKELWNWGKIKKPGFKIMPLNEVKKHFIRLDKKALKELGICKISSVNCIKKELYNNIEFLDSNKYPVVKEKTKTYKPIKIPNLKTHDKESVFYTDDEKTKIFYLENYRECEERWWLDIILDIYSKEANIRQLRREKIVRSPKDFDNFLKISEYDNSWCPWIPGLSFLTDGFQIKLPLVAIRNNRTPGIEFLFKRGFSGFKKKKIIEGINIFEKKKGVYVSDKQEIYLEKDKLKDYIFLGLDPGRNKPLSTSYIEGSLLPFDWRDESRIKELDSSLDKNYFFTNQEYRVKTGCIKQQEKEKMRRKGKYKEALLQFQNTNCKSCIISETEKYYNSRLETWNIIREEKYNYQRQYQKLESYSKTRRAISYFAKKIIKKVKNRELKENKKLLIFFGNGTFSPGGSGYAAAPKKPFIKELSIKTPVIITNEYNTSKLNPINFQELKNSNESKEYQNNKDNQRLRQCKTDSEVFQKSLSLSKYGKRISRRPRDRDAFGSVSICQKGIYKLLKNDIPYYRKT